MKPIFESVAAFPDITSAKLVREALVAGGLEEVEIQTVTPLGYLPRAHALDYEVRVPLVDVARAKLVLRDFHEEAERAATAQAGGHDTDVAPVRRGRWVTWLALGLLFFLLVGPAFSAVTILIHFARGLFGN